MKHKHHRPLIAAALSALVSAFALPVTALHADDGLWVAPAITKLPTDKQGPFVRTGDGKVLAIDATASYVSQDGGKTWSDARPLFSDKQV